MFSVVAGNRNLSAFRLAHEQYPQQPEFCEFKSTGANTAPEPYSAEELCALEDPAYMLDFSFRASVPSSALLS
jgi:hypothetical protein